MVIPQDQPQFKSPFNQPLGPIFQPPKDSQHTAREELEIIEKLLRIEDEALDTIRTLSSYIPCIYKDTLDTLKVSFTETNRVFKELRSTLNDSGHELSKDDLTKAQTYSTKHKNDCKALDELINALIEFNKTEKPKIMKALNSIDVWEKSIYGALANFGQNLYSMPVAARDRANRLYCDMCEIYKVFCAAKRYIILYRVCLPPSLEEKIVNEKKKYSEICNEAMRLFSEFGIVI